MTIETAAGLPLLPPPDEIEWTLAEPIGAFVPAFGYGSVQRIRYGTARWQAVVRYTKLSQDERAALLQFIAKVGRHRPFWLTDSANDPRGTFPAGEALVGQNAAAFWSSSSANRGIYADTDGIRVSKTGATAAANIATTAAVTVVATQLYAFQALFEAVSGASNSVGLRVGATQYAADQGATTVSSTMKRHVGACATASGTSMWPGWSDNGTDDSNWSAGFTYAVRQLSLRRAIYVDGGSVPTAQSGNSCYVLAAASQSKCLAAGDMVEFVSNPAGDSPIYQMVRLVENLSTDSAGKGKLVFEPTLRFPLPNGALVIPGGPRALMMLTEDPPMKTYPPRFISDLEFTCMEVPQ